MRKIDQLRERYKNKYFVFKDKEISNIYHCKDIVYKGNKYYFKTNHIRWYDSVGSIISGFNIERECELNNVYFFTRVKGINIVSKNWVTKMCNLAISFIEDFKGD